MDNSCKSDNCILKLTIQSLKVFTNLESDLLLIISLEKFMTE